MTAKVIVRKEGDNFILENGKNSVVLENIGLDELLESFFGDFSNSKKTTIASEMLKQDLESKENDNRDEDKVEDNNSQSSELYENDLESIGEKNRDKIPDREKIKDFIKQRDSETYKHATSELFEEFTGIKISKYSELRKNDRYKPAYFNLDNKLKRIRKEIESEEDGEFKKKQVKMKGKTRHTWVFRRTSEMPTFS